MPGQRYTGHEIGVTKKPFVKYSVYPIASSGWSWHFFFNLAWWLLKQSVSRFWDKMRVPDRGWVLQSVSRLWDKSRASDKGWDQMNRALTLVLQSTSAVKLFAQDSVLVNCRIMDPWVTGAFYLLCSSQLYSESKPAVTFIYVNLGTWKLGNSVTWKLGNSETLTLPPSNKNR